MYKQIHNSSDDKNIKAEIAEEKTLKIDYVKVGYKVEVVLEKSHENLMNQRLGTKLHLF